MTVRGTLMTVRRTWMRAVRHGLPGSSRRKPGTDTTKLLPDNTRRRLIRTSSFILYINQYIHIPPWSNGTPSVWCWCAFEITYHSKVRNYQFFLELSRPVIQSFHMNESSVCLFYFRVTYKKSSQNLSWTRQNEKYAMGTYSNEPPSSTEACKVPMDTTLPRGLL